MKIQSGQTKNFVDAFLYYAANEGKIDTQEIEFSPQRADIQTLNDHASRGDYEVTSVSAHCIGILNGDYNVISSGGFFSAASIISRDNLEEPNLSELKTAVGGTTTSEYLAGFLYCPEIRMMVIPADKLVSAVSAGIVDCAIMTSHDLLEVEPQGLCVVNDLGEWFKQTYEGLELPLTVAAVRKDVDGETQQKIQTVIEASVRYALDNRAEALDYAMQYAKNLDRLKVGEFLNKYVTDISVDMSEKGRKSIEKFLDEGSQKGLITKPELTFLS